MASDGTTIEAAYDYSPWGEVTKIAGTGVESDFLYTGHFYHDKSELHLTLYRAYNPELGMWLSRDPIAENGGINLYGYVGNDPISGFDPYGLIDLSDFSTDQLLDSLNGVRRGQELIFEQAKHGREGRKKINDAIKCGDAERATPITGSLDPVIDRFEGSLFETAAGVGMHFLGQVGNTIDGGNWVDRFYNYHGMVEVWRHQRLIDDIEGELKKRGVEPNEGKEEGTGECD